MTIIEKGRSEETKKKVSESMKKFHEKKRLEKMQTLNIEPEENVDILLNQEESVDYYNIVKPTIDLNSNIDYSTLGVVDQIRVAFKSENRLATISGFLLGGIVPFITYILAHYEIIGFSDFYSLFSQIATYLIIGGLIYSFNTVFYFGRLAFDSSIKSFGFTILIEGTMTFVHIQWLAIIALCYLIIINGIGTGVILALYKYKDNNE